MISASGVRLRQSYTRLGKIALIRHQRYAHAKQFKRANRMLRTLRTQLGRVIRDIMRKIAGNPRLRAIFARPLSLASQVRSQKQRQRGPKIDSLHAPEVACVGKGKAHRPYEFGVKVSVATTLNRSKGGQFVAHVAALPGNPYDGHTLASIIPAITQQIGVSLTQVIADAGYRGHNAPSAPGLRVFTAGQKRGVTQTIKPALRRRAAVEPVLGHLKAEHPHGPQLSRHTSRRCGQRGAGRSWVQLSVAAGLAGHSCALVLARSLGRTGSCERFDPDRVRQSRNPIRVLHGRPISADWSGPDEAFALAAVPRSPVPWCLALIATRDFLPFACLTPRSFLEHHPEFRAYLLLVDGEPSDASLFPEGEIVLLEELAVAHAGGRDASKFTAAEFSNALKPAFLNFLAAFARRVIYLDCDIAVFSRFSEMIGIAETCPLSWCPIC